MLLIRADSRLGDRRRDGRCLLGVNPVLKAEYQALAHKIDKQRGTGRTSTSWSNTSHARATRHLTVDARRRRGEQAVKAWGRLLPQRDELERQLA